MRVCKRKAALANLSANVEAFCEHVANANGDRDKQKQRAAHFLKRKREKIFYELSAAFGRTMRVSRVKKKTQKINM